MNFCHERKPINLGIVLLSCKGILIPASFVCFFSIVAQNVILVLCACLDDSEEAGWVPEQAGYSRIRLVNATSDGPPTRQSLHAFMRSLLKVVAEHADAWPFKEPVDAREVPDYYDIIKDPIDLRTISRRLDSEQYFITLDMFVADMKRMFSNARTYNSPDTIYYKCTNRLDAFFMNKLQAGIQVTSRPTHA